MPANLLSPVRFLTFRNAVFILGILFLLRMVSMTMLPLFDPSEARYGNICANMAEYGNFLEPKFMYEGKMLNFEGKPPLYFQMGGLF